MNIDQSRRRFLGTTATLAAVGLAGCSGDDGATETDAETDTPTETNVGGSQEAIDAYLSGDGNNYDGTVEDMTGNDTVTVKVGVGDQGYAYGPAAIRIDTGTTVEFEWTGRGQAHNVKPADNSDFPGLDSGDQVSATGVEYTYDFDESGLATYYCTPHQGLGMLGAIDVQ